MHDTVCRPHRSREWRNSHEDYQCEPHQRVGSCCCHSACLHPGPEVPVRAAGAVVGQCELSELAWSKPMKSVAIMLVIALGLIARAAASALVDSVPADFWDRLDRDPQPIAVTGLPAGDN